MLAGKGTPMAKTYRIAAIPGDGIGKEVMPEGVRVLDAAARKFGFTLAFDHFDWNCDRQVKPGPGLPHDSKEVGGAPTPLHIVTAVLHDLSPHTSSPLQTPFHI